MFILYFLFGFFVIALLVAGASAGLEGFIICVGFVFILYLFCADEKRRVNDKNEMKKARQSQERERQIEREYGIIQEEDNDN